MTGKKNKARNSAEEVPHAPEVEIRTIQGEEYEVVNTPDYEAEFAITERVRTIVSDLTWLDVITDDKGREVNFQGEAKDGFIQDVQRSFPVVVAMVANIHDSGKFLHEVRTRQKKNGLWIRFLKTIGLSRRTAHNYIQAYERFGDKMNRYSHLGVTKLLIASRVKDALKYVREHENDIAECTTEELTLKVAELRKRPSARKNTRKGTEPVEMGYQNVYAVASGNGKVLHVHGLDKALQDEVIKALKKFFSRKK